VILADEPTSSLDDPGAARVMEALWEASEGRTLLVVSHDPRLRARFEAEPGRCVVHDFAALISAGDSA
jgi:ABC-type lipoprotein export system ATPase subunit